MNGAKKIYVITNSILCGSSAHTEIIAAIENKRQIKELCKAHNKAQKGSLIPEIWEYRGILLFPSSAQWISYDAMEKEKIRIRKENESLQALNANITSETYLFFPCTSIRTAPCIMVEYEEFGGNSI